MTNPIFLFAAAGALGLALAFVVVPLRGGQRPLSLAGLILLVPAATLLVYLLVGTPEGIDPDTGETGQIRSTVTDLAERALSDPDSADNWARLGLAYKSLEEFGSAEHAFRRALFVDDNSPFLKAELGETLLYASGRRQLPDQAHDLLVGAAADDSQKALWLLGLDAFQREAFDEAERYFERLLAILPPESQVRTTVEQYLARTRSGRTTADPAPDPGDGNTGPSLDLSVTITPALAQRLEGDETVFVAVRRANAGGPPLAVRRLQAGRLPARLTLGDNDAMMPGAGMSSAEALVVVARVSFSGRAEPQGGDFEGRTDILPVNDDMRAEVHIDQVR